MQVSLNHVESRFEVDVNGQLAIASFEMEPGVMVVTHVIVPEVARGGGVGTALAEAVIKNARTEKLKIVPICPFMQRYFAQHPEVAQVLA